MKKLFALIMSVLMIACFMPTMAFAETTENCTGDCEHVAAIRTTHYDTLEAAVEATKGDDTGKVTITLLKDAENQNLTGPGKRMLEIDLNGHKLSGSIEKDHDLKIVDTSLENRGTAKFSFVRCNVLQLNGGTVTINDAQILHTTQIGDNAKVTINGGAYKLGGEHQSSVSVADDKTGTLTINAGVFWTDIKDFINNGKQEAISCTTYVDGSTGNKVEQTVYTVGAKEQGSYTVKKTTKGGETLYFYDLYTAAKAASDGDVITLLSDQTINRILYIDGSVTIDGGDGGKHTVTVTTPIRDFGSAGNIANGMFEFSGSEKTAAIKNVNFSNIDIETGLIRAYNEGSNSTLTVENCTFTKVKAVNAIRAASETAQKIVLIVKDCVFTDCKTIKDGNGIIQIDSNGNNGTSTIENNSFINNVVEPGGNAAVIYLSAPGKVKGNYFDKNRTKAADDNKKNGIVVTGANAVGSVIESNAFVSHTFENGNAQGAVYGASGATTVDKNYYGTGIEHLVNAERGFEEGTVATRYSKNSSGTGATTGTGSISSGGSYRETPLEKAKKEANTAISAAASANKYDEAEQAEVKAILDKAAADIKNAKTEEEVKAIREAAQAEIDKVLTTEEKAQIASVGSVDKDIFKAKSKYSKLNGKKAIKVTWNVPEGMKLDGYEVFRSTKKYSGFGKTPYFTTTNTSYTNNKDLVAGKTYYYKVRGFVEINGERYYTGFSTKAFRIIK